MKKKYLLLILGLLSVPAMILMIGFIKLKHDNPVTLTLWHNYGGQMKDKMDELIEEFNGTVGAKNGVIINVTSISGSSTLHEKLVMAANGDPGAPQLPDITTAYPKTALILARKDLLVDLEDLFSDKELSAYIPRFIEEGRLTKDHLYVFPTAKSTEVLFINNTLFNRFSQDTGASLEDLKTFEGIQKTAELYYQWTDHKTPNISDDGKTFYVADSLFNYNLIGCKQIGCELVQKDMLTLSQEEADLVWDSYFHSAIRGEYAIFDGYASDLAKTGDIVCSTGSTAGVVFFSPTITYPDNTTEPAELTILPYPVFKDGRKVAIQRGAGMCVTKSNQKKEELAGIFLKWFTSPKINLSFVSSTGYLPVTEEAFGDIMQDEIDIIADENIKKLLQVIREMQQDYDFYTTPLFDGVDELIDSYDTQLKALAGATRKDYIKITDSGASNEVISRLLDRKSQEFKAYFQ